MKAEKEDTRARKKGATNSSGQGTCAVCFDKVSPAVAKLDPGHRPLTCQKCGLCLHRRCGGAATFPEGVDTFVCERCSVKGKKPKVARVR